MDFAFAARLLAACAVIAIVLVGLQAGARLVLRAPATRPDRRSLLAIVETTFLPGAASLHVVRVAGRYYVVGRSGGHVQTLCEVAAEDVAPHAHRSAPVPSFGVIGKVVARLRGAGS